MKRREYEKKLAQWEAEGYDVSELRQKWFSAKKRHVVRWLSIVVAIFIIVAGVTFWQVTQKPAPPSPTLPPHPAPAPELTSASTFESIGLNQIQSAPLSLTEINGGNDLSNRIPQDTIILFKTNEGRYGKLQIKECGYDLVFRWLTFNSDGSGVYSQGDHLVIQGTGSCDLDSGRESTISADFWWEQVDNIQRYLVPKNGARFAVIPKPALAATTLGPFNYMTYLGMNTKVALFQDWRIRWAVYHALDLEYIRDAARTNLTQNFTKVVSIAAPDHACPALESGYDPDKAKKLLWEAGYPDGFQTTLHVPDGLEWVANKVHNDLKECGIDAQVKVWDTDTFTKGLQTGECEFFLAITQVNWSGTLDLLKRLLFSTGEENFTGFSDAKFDELLKTDSFAEAENLAFGSGGMTVVPLFWHETLISPKPTQELASYILSGGPSADVPIYVDDDFIVEVNGEVIFHDGDKASSTLDPIEFQASPEDSIHIVALDSGKIARELSSLYLNSNGKVYRVTDGVPKTESSELVFYDETFQISSLPEVTPYVISGGTSALFPIEIDDDLFIELNGKTIYQDDDGGASVLDPIKFFAMPDDTVHITAIDVGWGARNLSSLYLISDGKSYKITDAIKQDSKSGESIFFDETFKISEITGVGIKAEPAPTPKELNWYEEQGYEKQEPYTGDCEQRPEGMVCLRFDDGYVWLITDSAKDWRYFAEGGNKVQVAIGFKAEYYHVLNTKWVKEVN